MLVTRCKWLLVLGYSVSACVKMPASQSPNTPPLQLSTDQPTAQCPLHFRFDARGTAYEQISVAGEFNNWVPGAMLLTDPDGDFVYEGSFTIADLKPGRYAYKFIVSDPSGPTWILDPDNGREKVLGGTVNSMVVANDCTLPALTLQSATAANGNVTVVASVTNATAVTASVGGAPVPVAFDTATGTATVNLSGQTSKVGVTLNATNATGAADPLYVPLWSDGRATDWSQSILYYVMTDRFRNGDPSNDYSSSCLPADSPANWLGGDWAGITQAINEGYFDALGTDSIVISPINDNPEGCYPGSLGRLYSAYHAYFPLHLDQLNAHFGNEADLHALMTAAHAHGMHVLLDFVTNHLHDESPLVPAHKDWFNPFYVCGWDQPITCWFQPYLPDMNYNVDGANEAEVNAGIAWIERFDFDGFRFDAAQNVGNVILQNLRAEIADKIEHRQLAAGGKVSYAAPQFYMVGETFNGDPNVLNLYTGAQQLSGQFDYPGFYPIIDTLGYQSAGFSELKDYLTSLPTKYVPGSLMAMFLDNQDLPRFISHIDNTVNGYPRMDNSSTDNTDALGWSDQHPGQPTDPRTYGLIELAYAFIASQGEMPSLFYGDEVGLPGAGDPDNRHLMPWGQLSDQQATLLARYQSIGSLRHAHPALRSTNLSLTGLTPESDSRQDDVLAYFKHADAAGSVPAEDILVVLDRRFNGDSETLPIYVPVPAGSVYVDLETNETFTALAGELDVPMAHPQARYLQLAGGGQ